MKKYIILLSLLFTACIPSIASFSLIKVQPQVNPDFNFTASTGSTVNIDPVIAPVVNISSNTDITGVDASHATGVDLSQATASAKVIDFNNATFNVSSGAVQGSVYINNTAPVNMTLNIKIPDNLFLGILLTLLLICIIIIVIESLLLNKYKKKG